MSLLQVVLLLLLLPSLSISSTFYVNFARHDFYGNSLLTDNSLPRTNLYGNENEIFRELAGIALDVERENVVDFSVLLLKSAGSVQFNCNAPKLISLSSLSSYPSSSVSAFERICLLSGTQELSFEQRLLLEAVLVDLLRVIHPSIVGLSVGVDDLLLLIAVHFVFYSDRRTYDLEFDQLRQVFSYFSGAASEVVSSIISMDPNETLTGRLVSFSLQNGNFLSLWWLLQSGHGSWSDLDRVQVEKLVLMVLKQTGIDRAFVLKQIIVEFGGDYPVPDARYLVPIPLLWFVFIEVAKEYNFEGSDLLDLLIEEVSFDWNTCDETGCTIIGCWICYQGADFPQILIYRLLRSQLVSRNAASINGNETISFVKEIGFLSEQKGSIEVGKLARFLLESPQIDWPLAVREAFQSGQLWLFFRLFDDAVSRQVLDEQFLISEILDPLRIESRLPGELCARFERSHDLFLGISSGTVGSIPKYYAKWEAPAAALPKAIKSPRSESFLLSRSLNWSRSRSHSQGSSSPKVNMALNVLCSVVEILETRPQYFSLTEAYKHISIKA
jgi:hypothetical protein